MSRTDLNENSPLIDEVGFGTGIEEDLCVFCRKIHKIGERARRFSKVDKRKLADFDDRVEVLGLKVQVRTDDSAKPIGLRGQFSAEDVKLLAMRVPATHKINVRRAMARSILVL